MHSPNVDQIKLQALIHLETSGPSEISQQLWPCFDGLQNDFPQHAKKFVSLAVAELEAEGLVVTSAGTVFLRRPLQASKVSVEMDLVTAIRIVRILSFHSDAPTANPLRLSCDELRSFGTTMLEIVKLAQENKAIRDRAESDAEELRQTKLELKEAKSGIEKLRQRLNQFKKATKNAELEPILATHRIVEGVCKECGLSRKLIEDSFINCDHAKV